MTFKIYLPRFIRLNNFYVIIYIFLFFANRIELSNVQLMRNSIIFKNYPLRLKRAR